MRTKKLLAVVGMAAGLLISAMAAPMAVSADSGCSHGSGYYEPVSQVKQWTVPHYVSIEDGTIVECTITYTTYRRDTICRSCMTLLSTYEYTVYTHSVSH